MFSLRRLAAELLGTGLLVVGGVGTAVLAPQAGNVGIAFAFGLSLLALAYALGPVSGCHINPAVTLGMALSRRIEPVEAAGYVVAQCLGALGGAGLVYAIVAHRAGYKLARDGLGTNGYDGHSLAGYSMGAAVITEIVLTALLVLVVLAATDRLANSAVAGLPIGIALVVCHLVAIPIDGTSVNPARSLGPAVIAGGAALSQLWVFLLMPLVGGLIGAVLYRLLYEESDTSLPDPTTEAAAEAGGL